MGTASQLTTPPRTQRPGQTAEQLGEQFKALRPPAARFLTCKTRERKGRRVERRCAAHTKRPSTPHGSRSYHRTFALARRSLAPTATLVERGRAQRPALGKRPRGNDRASTKTKMWQPPCCRGHLIHPCETARPKKGRRVSCLELNRRTEFSAEKSHLYQKPLPTLSFLLRPLRSLP